MKKILSFISSMMLILLLNNVAFASNVITVNLDGETLNFDVQPQLIGGRTMVPLRTIFEALGAVVEWDDNTSTVTAYNEFYLVKATIGSNTMLVNGTEKQIDIPPMIVNSRTLVPARFVAEAFNCDVQWNASTKTVYITSKYNDYSQVEQSSEPSNDTLSFNYYDGTHIPTYTSVTRYNLHDDYITEYGETMYIYVYNEDAVSIYTNTLFQQGWQTIRSEQFTEDTYLLTLEHTTYKERVNIFLYDRDNTVCILPETNLLDTYPGTNIPTYTSITGEKLIEAVDSGNGGTIYSYSDDEVSLTNYMDFIGNNGWDIDVMEGNDSSYCIIMFTSQKESQESFMMTVEFAYEEVWVYIRD